MSLRRAVRITGVMGGVGLVAAGMAQPPDVVSGKTKLLGLAAVPEPTGPATVPAVVPVEYTVPAVVPVTEVPTLPPTIIPAIPPAPVPLTPPASDHSHPAETPPGVVPPVTPTKTPPPATTDTPSSGTLVPSASPRSTPDALPRMLAEARAAYSRLRDYSCHYVRQERVQGRLVPEEICELRVRTSPFSASVRVLAPKEYANRETAYISTRFHGTKVRFKETNKLTYETLSLDDPKVLADTRHPITNVGLLAVLDRVETAVRTEKLAGHPVQVLVSDYIFAGRPCTRYEIFADRPHVRRYAARHVLYVDVDTKLPVRYEAYDSPTPSQSGELIEVQSFVGLRTNTGLGEQAFTR